MYGGGSFWSLKTKWLMDGAVVIALQLLCRILTYKSARSIDHAACAHRAGCAHRVRKREGGEREREKEE